MQIYYFSNCFSNLIGGHFEIFTVIGVVAIMIGMFMFVAHSPRWIIVIFLGCFVFTTGLIGPETNVIYQNVINKPFELISDQDDAFLYIKTYEIDSNKKQVYIESKVYSFHKSLEIENIDGKNIIKREK